MKINKNKKLFEWKTQKTGFIILCIALVAFASILYVHLKNEYDSELKNLRQHGLELVRVLAEVPYEQLVSEKEGNALLSLTKYYLADSKFAYSAVINTNGQVVASAEAPGVIIPRLLPPADPSGWLAVNKIHTEDHQNLYYDFQAPIISNGKLLGYFRLGYFAPTIWSAHGGYPTLALESLPLFLMLAAFAFLMRGETASLRKVSNQINDSVAHNELKNVEIKADGELSEFIGNFNEFVSMARKRLKDLNSSNRELEASSKLLTYQSAKIKSVLHALPEGMILIDESGQISFSNSKVLALFGVKSEDGLDAGGEWCTDQKVKYFLNRISNNPLGNYINENVEFIPTTIPDRNYIANAYPLYSPKEPNSIQGTLVLFRDNTEENLAKSARGEFIAHVAHELKSPLNVLAMYSESLLREEGESYEFRVEAVNVIQDEVERISLLISNLLNITKIEMGSMRVERQRTKLRDLLEDIYNTLKRVEKTKNVHFNLDLPNEISPLYVDKDLLRIAINNLLTNAVKYSDNEGTITLSAEETDQQIYIKVSDEGIGIAEEDMPFVFDRFYRSESEEVRSRVGHGLGLSLVRDIVGLHNGAIDIKSKLNQGTEITITLENNMNLLEKAV